MRRGRLPAFRCRHHRVDGLQRPSGRNASPCAKTPSIITSPTGRTARSRTEIRPGTRAHHTRPVKDRIRDRLVQLSTQLGDADWLDGDFSAGDLMTVSVLLRLRPSGLLDEFPKLAAYVARGEARPAYERAFAAQWAINAGHSQAGCRGRGQHDQTSDPEAGI